MQYVRPACVVVDAVTEIINILSSLFFTCFRTIIVLLLKDWEVPSDANPTTTATGLDFKRPAIEHILRDVHTNNRHTRNMYGTDFVELMNKHELNDYYGTTMYSNASNASSVSSNVDVLNSDNGVASPITTPTTAHIAADSATPSNAVSLSSASIDNACLVGLCCCVQLQTSADLVKLEKAFKNITYRYIYCSLLFIHSFAWIVVLISFCIRD